MATKMAGRMTVQERAQIAARYEVRNSVVAVQRWWCTVKGRSATIRPETIKNCHSKLMSTGSVTDARRSGLPSTSRSEENVVLVREMFTRSPHKSTRQAARESGLSRHTIRTVLEVITISQCLLTSHPLCSTGLVMAQITWITLISVG